MNRNDFNLLPRNLLRALLVAFLVLFAAASHGAIPDSAGAKSSMSLGGHGRLPPVASQVVSLSFVTPVLAQASPEDVVGKFLDFLARILLAIGVAVLAFAGYEIARGRVTEGLLCILGGLILAMAIPMMKAFLRWAGVNI